MSHEYSGGRDSDQDAIPHSISVNELALWRREGKPHALLDVREAQELTIGKVSEALHIPMGKVPARLTELPQDVPLVVMCHHGMRSHRVMQFLHEAGWRNALNLEGGIDAWSAQVDHGVKRY